MFVVVLVPKLADVAPVRFAPSTLTEFPPPGIPASGTTAVTVGTRSYEYWSFEDVALVPSGLVTVMSTGPEPPGGVAVISVPESIV